MEIYYNTETKQVAIVLGYGIGNHLSIKYLQTVVADIKKLFPLVDGDNLVFLEVNQSSRRHRYHWYTRFPYDISNWQRDAHGSIIIEYRGENPPLTAYPVSSHKKGVDGYDRDETAEQVINRLIHD